MSIQIFSLADQMKPSVIGSRVLDPGAFLELLAREIQETGKAQGFDGAKQFFIQIRAHEVTRLISSGHGPRQEDSARCFVRDGKTYLKREAAFRPIGCRAFVFSMEHYKLLEQQHLEEKPAEPFDPVPEGTTHVLMNVEIIDPTTDRDLQSLSADIMQVADEET